MKYALETMAESNKNKTKNRQMLETDEMKVLRKIVGKTKIE